MEDEETGDKMVYDPNSLIILSGFAYKKGRFRKNWKRRFFELHSQGLFYYRDETKREYKGGIATCHLLLVEASQFTCPYHGWGLTLHWEKRERFLMQLSSEEERIRWYNALQVVIRTEEKNYNSNEPTVRSHIPKTQSSVRFQDFVEESTSPVVKEKLPSLFESVPDKKNECASIDTHITYANPERIVYELTEGPLMRNIAASVVPLLPNQMNIAFTAIPTSIPRHNIKDPYTLEEAFEMVEKRLKIDHSPSSIAYNNLCSTVKLLVSKKGPITSLPSEIPFTFCPWLPAPPNIDEVHPILNQFVEEWFTEKSDIKREAWEPFRWIWIYSLLRNESSHLTGQDTSTHTKIMSAYSSSIWGAVQSGAKKIVEELRPGAKTLLTTPLKDGEHYSNHSYQANGLVFSFCANTSWKFPVAEILHKQLSQEFRVAQLLHNMVQNLSSRYVIPPIFIVLYLGFRILVSPALPTENSLLLYGQGNNGYSELVQDVRELIANIQYSILSPSLSTEQQLSTNLHVHMARDGRIYFSNFSSMCASEPPVSGRVGSEYSNYFRLEFLLENEEYLHPNAYSSEYMDSKLHTEEEQQRISRALNRLLSFTIPRFVENLSHSKYQLLLLGSDSFLAYMHAHGINIRYMGYVRSFVSRQDDLTRCLMLEEIIARVYKNLLREQIRSYHLREEEGDGRQQQVISLVWQTIFSFLKMSEISENTYWNREVLPTMMNHFGDFFALPGNTDIQPLCHTPSALLRKYTDIVRLSKRLCVLLNVRINLSSWNQLDKETFGSPPSFSSWEESGRIPVTFLLPLFDDWWELLLENMGLAPSFLKFPELKEENMMLFVTRLGDAGTVIYKIINHIIRIGKQILYENACHACAFQQTVLFFLASIVDESVEELTSDKLYLPFELDPSDSLVRLQQSGIEAESRHIISNQLFPKRRVAKEIIAIHRQMFHNIIPTEELSNALLDFAVALIQEQKSIYGPELFVGDVIPPTITLVRGLLLFCQQGECNNCQERMLQCYELLFLTTDTVDARMIYYLMLIDFFTYLLDLPEDVSKGPLFFRTFVSLCLMMNSMHIGSDLDRLKAMYSSYVLASLNVLDPIPPEMKRMLEQCESNMNISEAHYDMENDLLTPEKLHIFLLSRYRPFLIKESSCMRHHALMEAEKELFHNP